MRRWVRWRSNCVKPELAKRLPHEFESESDASWVPNLDTPFVFVGMLLLQKHLTRFEHVRIYAAKVRNTSKMGSQQSGLYRCWSYGKQPSVDSAMPSC